MKSSLLNILKNKRMLFASTPQDGHVYPLTGLAYALMQLGCDVRWYTSAYYKKTMEGMGLGFYPFKQARIIGPDNAHDYFPGRRMARDASEKANFDLEHYFVGQAEGAFADIVSIREKFPFDLVITDGLYAAIPLIRTLNVPVVAIGVIPLAQTSIDLGPFGPGYYPPANEEQRTAYQKLRETSINSVYKSSIATFSELLERHHLPAEHNMVFDTLIKHASLYLQLGSPSFEYERSDLGSNVRFVGSLLPYQNKTNAKPWYDQRIENYRHIVLVTQGTIEKDITKLLEPTIEAFMKTAVLVIVATGGSGTQELRAMYASDNIIIEDYIPFADILPYVDIFITNGGYGGTLLSLSHHVPIIAAGLHEGKAEVCSRIGYFRYGIDLATERPTPEAIRAAVLELLKDHSYKQRVIQVAAEMRNYNASELCATYIAELLDVPSAL